MDKRGGKEKKEMKKNKEEGKKEGTSKNEGREEITEGKCRRNRRKIKKKKE